MPARELQIENWNEQDERAVGAIGAMAGSSEASDEQPFAIVCDSSCDLDPAVCQRMGVTLVSHRLTLSDIELLDRSMSGEDVARMLADDARVRATSPGAGSFAAVFDSLIEVGYREIVVACPSARLLGTYDAAIRAAGEFEDEDVNIRVVDTKCTSGQLAFVIVRLALDRAEGRRAVEAVARIRHMVSRSRLWTLLPPTVDYDGAHVLGNSHGLVRSLKTLRMRVSGGWILTTVSAQSGEVEIVRNSDDLAWLAGLLARTVSLYSQEVGPVTLLELSSRDDQSLAELRRPLDTNEFEKQIAGTLSLRPSTLTRLGSGAVGLAAIPQSMLAPTALTKLLEG